MLRRLSVRGKVLAVLAVPILVLVLATAFISAQALNEVRVARAINNALDSLQTVRVFAQALQAEREVAINHVGELALASQIDAGFVKETNSQRDARAVRAKERADAVQPAYATTDATRTRAFNQLNQIDFEALDPLVQQSVTRLAEAVENGISTARHAVERGDIAPNIVDTTYTGVIRESLQLIDRFAATIDNRSLGVYLAAYSLVDLTQEAVLNEREFGGYAIDRDGADASANAHLRGIFPNTDSLHSRARAAVAAFGSDDLSMPDFGVSFDGFALWTSQRTNIVTSNLGFESVRPDDADGGWREKARLEAEALNPTLSDLWRAAENNAQQTQSAALSQATLTIIIAVVALALSVLVALLIARTIVVPLQRLTTAAGEVRDQLPRLVEQVSRPGEGPDLSLMQIPVESQDEVGTLARAFNEVNQTTVEVAQEQAALRGSIAEMFVNVARRDQVLLNRQLSFIDTLEREEEDPNTLANLFRLDHLATRMRRNAESLLVLAGIDSGRRVRGSMTLSDVIRTASSEIEQYDRVELDLGVDPHMHGFNSLPAAHLIAEILENATVFSEPGTPVDVKTSAEIEFITVTVVDRGLGMSDEDIKNANQRIRQTTASEVIGAQRLGLHVVGRLANRLGTKVVFARAEGESGTEVRIRFPRALFVDDAHDAQPGHGGRLLKPEELVAQVQEEAPLVAPVDLEALTDGETGLGLPRRRASEAPQAPAPVGSGAPAAPAAEAPSTSSGLPARRNIVLPETVAPTLAPEVAASAAGWAPAVAAPAASSLPSRAAGSTAAAKPIDDGPVAPPRPAAAKLDPSARSGMFAGFRTAQSAQQQGETGSDGVEETPAAPEPAPMAIPGLAPDDDDAPVVTSAPSAGTGLPQRGASFQDSVQESLAHEAPVAETAAPAWGAPAAPAAPEQPAAAWGASAPESNAWGAPAQEAPQWGAPAAEAPSAGSPAVGAPAQEEPAAWAPSAPAEEPVVEPAPSWGAPAAEAPSPWAAPVQEQPAAWAAPVPEAPAAPTEEPSWQQPAVAVPSWGPSDAAWSPAMPVVDDSPELAEPEPAPEQPAATQYPAFSPDAGYAAPEAPAWSQDSAPAWSQDSAPAWSPEAPVAAAPEIPTLAADTYEQPAYEQAAYQPSVVEQPAYEQPAVEQPAYEQSVYQQPQYEQPAAYEPAAVEPAAYEPAAYETAPEQPSAPAAWSQTSEPVLAPSDSAPAGPAWLSATAPAPAAAPSAPSAPAAALPAFSELVGDGNAGTARRSRRAASSAKPSRADRRAQKKAEAKARAEAKAAAKAQARAAKKGKAVPAQAAAPAAPAAPATPGFLSQPTSIAALRSQASSASAPSASSAALSSPQPSAPSAPVSAASAPSPAAWTPPVDAPPAPAAWSAPAPAAQPAAYQPAFQPAPAAPLAPTAPSAPAPGATFTPAPAGAWSPNGGAGASPRQFGVLDDEVAAMLALRSDIQEQALSELSQLSAYRPKVVKPAEALAKRTPSAIPSAPEIAPAESSTPHSRDPEQLRSRLSSFQSGTSRGRRAQPAPTDSVSSTDGTVPPANGSAEHAAPGASTSEPTQEAQTW